MITITSSPLQTLWHLIKRFGGSISRRAPEPHEVEWARSHLPGRLAVLWSTMSVADQRHSIIVARRFAAGRPTATPEELAGALLHDIGKTRSGLGTMGRVAATILGPRTPRFRLYHRHEELGAALAAANGAPAAVVDMIGGEGPAADDLRAADDI